MRNVNVKITLADSTAQLQQILTLQDSNHLENLPVDKRNTNGFVTVKHDLELLKQMNESTPQIIAVDDDMVVGYALVMLKEFSKMIPVLTPMFNMFEELDYREKSLSAYRYYVMGQICIKESHRGQGIFEALYLKHKEVYANRFDLCLTEVSTSNIRSMKAHEKIGFKTIHTFKDNSDHWNILLWDWN